MDKNIIETLYVSKNTKIKESLNYVFQPQLPEELIRYNDLMNSLYEGNYYKFDDEIADKYSNAEDFRNLFALFCRAFYVDKMIDLKTLQIAFGIQQARWMNVDKICGYDLNDGRDTSTKNKVLGMIIWDDLPDPEKQIIISQLNEDIIYRQLVMGKSFDLEGSIWYYTSYKQTGRLRQMKGYGNYQNLYAIPQTFDFSKTHCMYRPRLTLGIVTFETMARHIKMYGERPYIMHHPDVKSNLEFIDFRESKFCIFQIWWHDFAHQYGLGYHKTCEYTGGKGLDAESICEYGLIVHNNWEEVLLLLQGLDHNENDLMEIKKMPPYLFRAIKENNPDIIKFVIGHGANINIRDGEPLLFAIDMKADLGTIKFLIEYGANVNIRDGEPLLFAINKINLLPLVPGEHPSLSNKFYRTREKVVDLIKVLIEHGANVNIRDGEPLMFLLNIACGLPVVKLLLEHGANVNIRDGEPLLVAIDKGRSDYVKLLIDHGVNVNIRDGEPLRRALRILNREIIELLINHGANVDINECYQYVLSQNNANHTRKKEAVLSYLVYKGADDVKNTKRQRM